MADPGDVVQTVRVLPDVAAIRREFDYAVPSTWTDDGRASLLAVGSMVRVELHGRRVAGWVTELNPAPEPGVVLRPLAKLSGMGPPAEVVGIARWAAARWVGPTSALLGTASPPKMVAGLSAPSPAAAQPVPDHELARLAVAGAGAVVRVPPLGDRWPYILAAVAQGNALILVPSLAQAAVLVDRLRRRHIHVGLYPRDWARGAAGATIVGGRAAAMAPVTDLAAVLMIDEHDEVYQEERSPTWHAREIVLERARRGGVPCILTSPIPTPEARAALEYHAVSRADERSGWPTVSVVDPREDSAARGTLWTSAVVKVLRRPGRVACIVNRKGRSRLLSCGNCGDLAVCQECERAVRQDEESSFVCALGHRRPLVCPNCLGTSFKNLRVGVTRAREELEALLREPVVEVTGDSEDGRLDDARVLVGTEALLHRVDRVSAVVFCDFDQELVAPRYRAGEEALALTVRAGRLVGGRDGDGLVVLQTRQPSHPVVRAAQAAAVEEWGSGESARRELLGYPPYQALAEVSGAAAPAFMERLGRPLGLKVQGPADGRWLVRADDHDVLAELLAAVERPKGRLRIAVDPLRV